jgi:hypothetical protein
VARSEAISSLYRVDPELGSFFELGPPIAQFGVERLPGHWHPFVANTFSMAVSTAVAIAVLLPLPGFDLPS